MASSSGQEQQEQEQERGNRGPHSEKMESPKKSLVCVCARFFLEHACAWLGREREGTLAREKFLTSYTRISSARYSSRRIGGLGHVEPVEVLRHMGQDRLERPDGDGVSVEENQSRAGGHAR